MPDRMNTKISSRILPRAAIVLIVAGALAWLLFSPSSPVTPPERAIAPTTNDLNQNQDGGAPFTERGCVVTGCSKEVCASEEIVTACVFKPEYLCYRKARCERQTTGECGWTGDQKLTICLETAPALDQADATF